MKLSKKKLTIIKKINFSISNHSFYKIIKSNQNINKYQSFKI